MTLHRPHGSLADGTDPVALTPDEAGWSFAGLRVLALAPGVERSISTGESEGCLLPLSATDVTVRCDGDQYTLDGRASVFARVTDFAYVPRDAMVTLGRRLAGDRDRDGPLRASLAPIWAGKRRGGRDPRRRRPAAVTNS